MSSKKDLIKFIFMDNDAELVSVKSYSLSIVENRPRKKQPLAKTANFITVGSSETQGKSCLDFGNNARI